MKRPGRFIIVDDSTIHDSNDDCDDIPRLRKRQRIPSPTVPGTFKRKAMSESRPSLKPDYDGTVILIHDPKYFFEDDPGADCFIRVEKILFKVHSNVLCMSKLIERRITGRAERTTRQDPLELFGISVTEFRALMWARYATEDDAEGQPRNLEDLERLLSLTTVTKNFEYDCLHDWALNSIYHAFSSDSSLVDSCSSVILTRVIEVASRYKAKDLLDSAVSKWCDRIRRKDSPAVPAILAADEHKLEKLAGVAYYVHLLETIEQAPPPSMDIPLQIRVDPKLNSKHIVKLLSGHLSLVNFSERYRRRAPKLDCTESCSVDAHKACMLVWNERWQAAAGSRRVLALCSADVLGLVAEMSEKLSGDGELTEGVTETCRLAALENLKQTPNPDSLRILGPQGVNLWKLEREQAAKVSKESFSFVLQGTEDAQGVRADSDFEAQWFEQPLDHFSKGSNHTFLQRYWVNNRHYVAGSGGPVIVLDGGETSGEDRLTYLDTGIVEILTRATGGLGVVLEHRYYGQSIPVDNFTTDSLRWLDNEQAAADSANFMSSVKFEGINEDLTASNTPWIYYGGSYAGARAAHMKILYPELTYGSIASSAVTHAALSNWEYMEVIRRAADSECSGDLEQSIIMIDSALDTPQSRGPLKELFGLKDLQHDDDFVSLLSSPLGSWQSRVWGPFNSTAFDDFCSALTKPSANFSSAAALPFGSPSRMISITDDLKLDFVIDNYATYIKDVCPFNLVLNAMILTKSYISTLCQDVRGTGQSKSVLERTTILNTKSQPSTKTGACGNSKFALSGTAPPDQEQPRIISRRLTLEYLSKICKQAYPPGKFFTVPPLPNITAVNSLGDFDIAADRLAFIDGEVDPWRPDTPHSQFYAKDRPDTILRPFKRIPGAVHHWDEWGLLNISDEPPEIQKIHEEEIGFVTAWLKDFKAPGEH
ncbi:hypothetical protein C0992_004115 [Termitomyces sp. T32_za158]|nr:hypothetical protein C0992_004115 [Termitomyces sp. T32_za158]